MSRPRRPAARATQILGHLSALGLLIAWLAISGPPGLVAAEPATVIQDTGSLRDIRGTKRSLEEFCQSDATVLVFLGVDCPVANVYLPRLKELDRQFAPRGVSFVAVYPHENEPLDVIANHALEAELPFPVLRDVHQRLADALGITRTPETAVLDRQRRLRYRGRIDDQYRPGQRRDRPEHEDLLAALEALLAGGQPPAAETPPEGCLLSRRAASAAGPVPTFYGRVEGILRRRCGDCHREGGMAPFTLQSLDDAVRWSEMIGEVVRDRRMPPWPAVGPPGQYANDRRLEPAELSDLLAWIDGGMPRGNPAEAEPAGSNISEGDATGRWSIRQPDVVLEPAQPFAVPATGTIPYQYALAARQITDAAFPEDRWVQEAEILPRHRQVVHHLHAFLVSSEVEVARFDQLRIHQIKGVISWSPGKNFFRFPEGTALFVPRGTRVLWEVHYTPNGRVVSDLPSLGLVFARQPPRKAIQLLGVFNETFRIPPGDRHYKAESWYMIPAAARILAAFPHMHRRGKGFIQELLRRDGSVLSLVRIPRYDFDWQTIHWFNQPVEIGPGDRLHGVAWWDNSSLNPGNPDPTASVGYGMETSQEMMESYYYLEVDPARVTAVDGGGLVVSSEPEPKAPSTPQ